MSAPEINLESIRKAWESLGTPSAISELQQEALEHFLASGFPTPRLEDWKYTDTRVVAENYPQWLATRTEAKADLPDTALADDAIHLVFIDGRFAPEHSSDLPASVYAGSLALLMETHPEASARTFGKLATASGYTGLNTAFTQDVAAVVVPDNTELGSPVHLSFHTTTPEVIAQPRLLIDLGKNAHATVIEHYTSTASVIVNAVSEARCDAGADLTWYRLQAESTEASHLSAQYLSAEQDATVRTTSIDIGAQLARNELHVTLAGRGAHAECKGLFLADQKRHVDSRITVDHAAPDTTSRERFRGVLAGKARGVFNGRIHVLSDAQKTSAELTNRNLLLNPGAEVNAKPELEIYADDVKCAHGSTTGQLDKTSLFYLLSRGIDPEEARVLLIRAFVGELLTDISVAEIRDITQDALARLGTHDDG